MRICTWNLERGRNSQPLVQLQRNVLDGVRAEVEVLTEVPTDLVADLIARSSLERVGRRGPEAWVGIRGSAVASTASIATEAPLTAAAWTDDGARRYLIYGSVLPWVAARRQLPDIVEGDESAQRLFNRVLDAQVSDIERVRRNAPGAVLIWAGDFNQTLQGPNWGGSKLQRELLVDALDVLDLVAWNADQPHAKEGMCALDLICGPRDVNPLRVERIQPELNGRILSDHAGYVVDL